MTPTSPKGTGRDPRRPVRIVALIGAAVVLGLIAAVAGGFVPLPGTGGPARPPCEQLPPVREVQEALATRAALADRLEAVGDGVEVAVSTPCDGPDRALVRIIVSSDEERDGVDQIMNADGFGVPAELAMR